MIKICIATCRKKVAFALLFVFCLILSGCIDIFQYITKDENGNDRNTIKVTVSKTVFAMANGLSSSKNDIDYEKLFNESNKIDIKEYNQFNASVNPVNDILDIGYLVNMTIDYRDRNTINKINRSNVSFIPKYNGKNMSIHIDAIGDKSGSKNDTAAAFLATGKYRLVISKKCIADIDRVTIRANNQETGINFLNLYDEFLVEIPIPLVFTNDLEVILYSK